MIRSLGIVLLVAFVAPACAKTGATTADTQELVSVAARLQCDRQRFAFDSLDELDVLLDQSLAAADVTAAAFAEFERRLEQDEGLRLEVLEEFGRYCER